MVSKTAKIVLGAASIVAASKGLETYKAYQYAKIKPEERSALFLLKRNEYSITAALNGTKRHLAEANTDLNGGNIKIAKSELDLAKVSQRNGENFCPADTTESGKKCRSNFEAFDNQIKKLEELLRTQDKKQKGTK